jgi:hypothetical protein
MSNLAVQDDSLLELAKALGLDVEALEAQSSVNGGGSGIWTNFTKVPNVRVVNGPKWLDGGIFKWCEPGQPDYVEDIEDMPEINRLGGIIVHAEIQGSLTEKTEGDSAEKGQRVCSVVGYKNPVDGSYIKALPDFYPLSNMYGAWNKEANCPDRSVPNNIVEELDLLGSRGSRCVDCIRGGNSFLTDETGKVVSECSLYGRLYFFVTHVSKVKLVPPKKGSDEAPEEKVVTKAISELYPGETGLLVILNLPAVTGIRGKYSKDEKVNIRGYANYIRHLQMTNTGVKKAPVMNYTTINIKKPPVGSKSTKNLLHFDSDAAFGDYSLIRDAQRLWNESKPEEDVRQLSIEDFGGTTKSANVADIALPAQEVVSALPF